MARDYELYKELCKTKYKRLITDFVIKGSILQLDTNLVGVGSYSEPASKRSRSE